MVCLGADLSTRKMSREGKGVDTVCISRQMTAETTGSLSTAGLQEAALSRAQNVPIGG